METAAGENVSDKCLDFEEEVEELCEKRGLNSDKELAEFLGLTKSTISQWRNERTELGLATKLRVLAGIGYEPAREVLERVAARPGSRRDQQEKRGQQPLSGNGTDALEDVRQSGATSETDQALEEAVRLVVEAVMRQSSGRWAMVRERINQVHSSKGSLDDTVRDVAEVLMWPVQK